MKVNKAKVMTMSSSKGGIGKTVFLTNLAGIYHFMKKKTLLIDLDLFTGGISTALNLRDNKTIYNLVDDIINNRLNDVHDYVVNYSEYIDVLPSCKDPRQGHKIEPKYVEQIIEIYRNMYDIILIDTTHIPLSCNLIAMDMSDVVMYMISNDPIDLANSKSTMAIFNDIDNLNIKVILNNSFDLSKNYFSNYDIKSIIKKNIDFILNKSLFIPNIDKYIMDGKILVLNDKLSFRDKKDRECLLGIANKLYGDWNNEK